MKKHEKTGMKSHSVNTKAMGMLCFESSSKSQVEGLQPSPGGKKDPSKEPQLRTPS